MLCYSCFSYGHTRVRCPGPQRCVNCSNNFHGEECGEASFCRNCKGDHRPTNRQCLVYKKEVEVIKIKVRDNLSFPEARKRVELQAGGSYAQVAAQQNEFEKKLKVLEVAMLHKDKEIARLQEKSKKKDEKIEQMMNFLKQSKQSQERIRHNSEKIVSQEKAHHNRQQPATQSVPGPVTRSRNNSPAIQETKRGRPSKYNFAKPASPDRLSPPPKTKKTTASTQDLTQMDYSGEESEVSETPPNQRLR